MVKGFVDNNPNSESEMKNKILNLKNGESIVLNNPKIPGGGDLWDRDLKKSDAKKSKDLHQYNATGKVKLRSHGSIKATRKGDEVEIVGVVDNSIKDIYDFNEEDILFSVYRNLAKKGNAKPFLVYGNSLEKVKGKIKLGNGDIQSSKFEWEEIEH